MDEQYQKCPHCDSTRRIYLNNKIYCRKCYSKLPKGFDNMFNKCEHLKIRTKKGKKYLYCSLQKKILEKGDCYGCKNKKFKKYKSLKNQSSKQRKKESKRYSVFTNDMEICIECGNPKEDKHECIGGSNRSNSIKYGLVVPFCRNCHNDPKIRKKWLLNAQDKFIELYGYNLFIKIFKIDFKKKQERLLYGNNYNSTLNNNNS